ncbi:MAG: hypothetical protein K5893_07130 [Prevotella sp.]|nr:hypothetical protein [Prevotella sp.]
MNTKHTKNTIKTIATLLLAFSVLSAFAQDDRYQCDDTCSPDNTGEPTYNVVSPVGFSTVEPIEMAPRLSTLNGKTIAVVGEDFMYNITHPEIKRLILENYPDAKVILYDELPIAGPYPAPGITRQSTELFRQRLIELKVDAVIAGNGGCGICTPKETGSCIVAERMGIPSVIVTAPGFDNQARYTARNNGVPVLRVAIYPGAFASHTEEQLIQNTDDVTWPQIVAALTTPISPDEYVSAGSAQAITDDVFHGSIDEIYTYFRTMGWSDGAPFNPPTYEKVQKYLDYTDYKWDETIAILPAAFRNTTTWHVAVNACMAGCKPEYMPILIAMTKAMADGNFRRTLASTHAWVPYSWLNGPVTRQLGISSSQGEINAEANTAIGRFMNLAMMNLAGYYVGQSRMGTFGYLQPWCLVEDEDACKRVGWPTWNEQQGFSVNDNTITLSSALMWGNNMAPSTTDSEKMMQLMAWDISERCQFALGSGKQFTNRVVLMTEPVAGILAQAYPTIETLEDALIENSRRSAYERAFANYYANPGSRKDGGEHTFRQYLSHIEKSEGGEETQAPEWYDTSASTMVTIPTMEKGATAFIITGDASRNKIQTMPGGGFSTVGIELPAAWDSLMADLGYKPLSEYMLESADPLGIQATDHRSTSSIDDKGSRMYTIGGQGVVSRPSRGVYIEKGKKQISR